MFRYNDGGRSKTGSKSDTDCGIRALAICCGVDYKTSQKILRKAAKNGKNGSGQISKGIYKEDMDSALITLGWKLRPAPKFSGRKARYSDLPKGRVIARMAGHFAAVVDGVLEDTWDSRDKMVYCYWSE